MRLNQFDYFRALAILLIVFDHTAMSMLGVYSESAPKMSALIYNLVTGGSNLFVFISGFFFHYIFYQKFNYQHFILKKIKNVYAPYLFISTIIFLGFYFLKTTSENEVAVAISQQHSLIGIVGLYFTYIANGSILLPYWYIPFIMLLFLASPLFVHYIKSQTQVRIAIMLVCFGLALLVQRPTNLGNSLHSLIFYIPMYLFGINYSIHREKINEFIKNKTTLLGCGVLLLAAGQYFVLHHIGSYHKNTLLSFNGISVILIQKVFLILFLMSLLLNFEKNNIPFLKEIATSSFAIFFLHMFTFYGLLSLKVDVLLAFMPSLLQWLIISSLVVLTSYSIAFGIKKLFKQHSRLLIGW